MPRTVVDYVRGKLNKMASLSPSGSVEAATGLPIATGLTVGSFFELSDAEALALSDTTVGTLYSGTYMWVQIDPAVVSAVALGAPLYWLQTAAAGTYIVTNVATANTNDPDYAGVNIDTGFVAVTAPYAFIQINGKASCLFDSSHAVEYGDVVNTTASAATFAAIATGTLTTTRASVGYALSAGAASTVQQVRITRPVTRF